MARGVCAQTIQGIKLADPYIPESVIQQYVMKGFSCRTADDLSTVMEMGSKLAIAKIMKRIRKGAFMPSKKSAAKHV
ncbi:hypothetical protein CYMTET_32885 [Cymbomonas tetramitiformis]|uniref:Uncharacterized protein n=1 Tax=Cymbomonas tetramitiformis TaxID=36881 RepID=A0AAE0FE50_9CHLO|nr:hypothetical protein CYMTET_32885 [Cymbomonas tetramitiformis]